MINPNIFDLADKFGLSAATGFFAGLVLALCGVDLAPLFGLMAFLLNFIPIVGSVIATLIPLPIVLFQPDMTLYVHPVVFACCVQVLCHSLALRIPLLCSTNPE